MEITEPTIFSVGYVTIIFFYYVYSSGFQDILKSNEGYELGPWKWLNGTPTVLVELPEIEKDNKNVANATAFCCPFGCSVSWTRNLSESITIIFLKCVVGCKVGGLDSLFS
jgi:hypothetical protein